MSWPSERPDVMEGIVGEWERTIKNVCCRKEKNKTKQNYAPSWAGGFKEWNRLFYEENGVAKGWKYLLPKIL